MHGHPRTQLQSIVSFYSLSHAVNEDFEAMVYFELLFAL